MSNEQSMSQKVVAWARPVYARPVSAPDTGEWNELVDIEFHARPEKPEGEGWRPLVLADTCDDTAPLPRINVRCETVGNGITGVTYLKVIRVEQEDDGSFTAVIETHSLDDVAQQTADDEVVFIDGVGAVRCGIESCRDGVQWIMMGDRVYWPLSDADAQRLQSACCGNGSFDGPSTVVQPEASTTLEQAESHARICAKLAEQHKSDPEIEALRAEVDALRLNAASVQPELVAVALAACDAVDDLIEKWYATRESGCLPNQVVRARGASKLLRAIALEATK